MALRWREVSGGAFRLCLQLKSSVTLLICQQEGKKKAAEKQEGKNIHFPTHTQACSAHLCNTQEALKLTKVKSALEYCHLAPKKLTVGTNLHAHDHTFTHTQVRYNGITHYSFKTTQIYQAREKEKPSSNTSCAPLTCPHFVCASKQPEAFWFVPGSARGRGRRVVCLRFYLLLLLDAVPHYGAVLQPPKGGLSSYGPVTLHLYSLSEDPALSSLKSHPVRNSIVHS